MFLYTILHVCTLVRVDILDVSPLSVALTSADCKSSLEVSLLGASADCRNSLVRSIDLKWCQSIIENDHDICHTPYPQYLLVAFQEV